MCLQTIKKNDRVRKDKINQNINDIDPNKQIEQIGNCWHSYETRNSKISLHSADTTTQRKVIPEFFIFKSL